MYALKNEHDVITVVINATILIPYCCQSTKQSLLSWTQPRNHLKITSNLLIAAGTQLLLFNVIDFSYYTAIRSEIPYVLDRFPEAVNEANFWENAYRISYEPLDHYLQRLSILISRRMLLIDGKYTKPTIFVNWILRVYSHIKCEWEWSDTEKAVRLGGGYCS